MPSRNTLFAIGKLIFAIMQKYFMAGKLNSSITSLFITNNNNYRVSTQLLTGVNLCYFV